MKQNIILLSQQYEAALRKYLQAGSRASPQPASTLGRQAVALGLDTLELARLHEQVRGRIDFTSDKSKGLKRAEIFFAAVNRQIEETRRVEQKSEVHLNRLKKSLDQRTQELAAKNRQLQRGVVQRKVMEHAAEKSGRHYKRCLEESLELQKRLRQLTHRVLVAQEDERKNISLELHDEIAQTLLGINIRLLSLKQEARVNHRGLKGEIASTQQLVVKSVKSVQRVARELENA